jgi:hypothetical protein
LRRPQKTWATPVLDVGTDSKEYDILAWTAQTGVLEGAKIPFLTQPLQPVDKSFNILSTSVLGSILQHSLPVAVVPYQLPRRRVRTRLAFIFLSASFIQVALFPLKVE